MFVSRIARHVGSSGVTKPILKQVHTVVGGVSPTEFVQAYQLEARPALFKQLVVAESGDQRPPHTVYWRALRAWSTQDPATHRETLDGLIADDTEHIIVPVEVSAPGRGYNSSSASEWQRLEMPFNVFVNAFIQQELPWSASDDTTTKAERHMVGYMAQYDLLSAVPRLAQDAPGLAHTRAGPKQDREQWRSNTWIGPAHTFTPLHRDPYQNMFVQVVGGKRVHLISPTLAQTLLPGRANTVPGVLSEADLLEPDAARYPDLHKAVVENSADVTQAILQPGDVLYIPQGWLHCVHSLSTSVSVNFWYR